MPHCKKCGAPVWGDRCLCPAPKDPGPWLVFDAPGSSGEAAIRKAVSR